MKSLVENSGYSIIERKFVKDRFYIQSKLNPQGMYFDKEEITALIKILKELQDKLKS